MKKIIYFKYLFCCLAMLNLLAGCNTNDDLVKGSDDNGIFIVPAGKTAIESNVLLSFNPDYKFPLAVAIVSPAAVSSNATIALDNSLITGFNTRNNTSYSVMPEGSCSLETANLTIPKDGKASQQTNLIINPRILALDTDYLLPIKVASVSTTDITLNDALATKYYIFRVPTPVRGNLSNGKPASKNGPSGSPAARGNDGNTNGDWAANSVCETGAIAEGYWQVDLGAVSPLIDDVKIWNRTDCCDDRTVNFYVFISNVPFKGTSVAESLAQQGVKSFYTPGKAGRPTQILTAVSGRYIRVQNTGFTSLTLAEFTATGIKP
ncbi:hypothetical protein RCH18_000203 [Flavobacterium sp. PL11]|jgi:hypothetical protein|uniref:BT_3987 domain-containing protein n=1 Tax=Flavobacterium sp. PL11 TaxID=3071717 RepID=UPI002DFFCC0A|nr:hypothetical protein [Flavobacterium sp. PL11]